MARFKKGRVSLAEYRILLPIVQSLAGHFPHRVASGVKGIKAGTAVVGGLEQGPESSLNENPACWTVETVVCLRQPGLGCRSQAPFHQLK
jgi:hypothetical protein